MIVSTSVLLVKNSKKFDKIWYMAVKLQEKLFSNDIFIFFEKMSTLTGDE